MIFKSASFLKTTHVYVPSKLDQFASGSPFDAILFRYGQDPDDFEYAMSEFLRMNGMYWGVACMDLIDRLHEMDR